METEASQSLEKTPTWAVGIVVAVFTSASFLIERAIFYTGRLLRKRNLTSLVEALEKIKEELMLVGFISVLLTSCQKHIAKICIPDGWARIMHPCKSHDSKNPKEMLHLLDIKGKDDFNTTTHGQPTCTSEGKAPFVPLEGLHQLHILIFIMAAIHIGYSVITIALGTWKVYGWNRWEDETKTEEYRSSHGGKLRYARESTFIRHHTNSWWIQYRISSYVGAFFQQFFRSVTKTDYMTLRHGFIMTHMDTNIYFNFHKYILRSVEDDFQHIVGISPTLWVFAAIFMVLNVYGWQAYFWVSFIPLLMVLLINTKLRLIIIKMAIEITEKHSVILGIPLVKPRDNLFWFNRPHLLRFLIHFVLFQNAFELAYYIWGLTNFGSESCFRDYDLFLLARLVIGVFVQLICSYVTVPLYALVTQMGTHHKKVILEKHIAAALVEWRKKAKRNAKNRKENTQETMEIAPRASTSPDPNANFDDHFNDHELELDEEDRDTENDKPPRLQVQAEIIERVESRRFLSPQAKPETELSRF